MLKKRLIFTLLYEDGFFVLSRNFSLQKVGDFNWLKDFYDFNSICFSVDELIVLDVSRGARDRVKFSRVLQDISQSCFMPIAAGGGIRSVEDADLLLKSGADKIIVNTALFKNIPFVRQLVSNFGAQCIVASIDFISLPSGATNVYIANGSEATGLSVEQAVTHVQNLDIGEIYLTSITQDGTGRGFDVKTINTVSELARCPLIASGGAGTFDHIVKVLSLPKVAAVSTANLFNFMSDNLTEARSFIIKNGIPLATWPHARPFVL